MNPVLKGSYNYAHGMTDIQSIGQHRFLVETELACRILTSCLVRLTPHRLIYCKYPLTL